MLPKSSLKYSQTEAAEADLIAASCANSLQHTKMAVLAISRTEANRCDPNQLTAADPIYWAVFIMAGC